MLGQSVSLWSKIKTDIKTAVSRLFDKRRVLTTGDGVVTVEDDQGNIATIPQLRGSLVQPGDDVLVLRALNSEIVLGPISTPGVAADTGVPPHEHTGPATFSTRLGTGAEASHPNATAIGVRAKAGLISTAVGNDANAEKTGSVVVGQFSGAGNEFSTAIGQFAYANGKRSFVVGQGAFTNVDDRGVLRANEVVIDRSDGVTGATRIGVRDSSGNVHWIGVTNSNITFDGNPVSGGGSGSVDWDDITNKPSTFPPSSHQHNASAIIAGTLDADRIPNLAISKITNLQTSLDDKVSKSAGGTQNITGSLNLSGAIGATGGIINGIIINGDPNNSWPWGEAYLNSPTITDVYGAPKWDGDTGLGISHINGLQSALNGKVNTGDFTAYQTAHAAVHSTLGTLVDSKQQKVIFKRTTRSGTANAAAAWTLGQGTTFSSAVTNITTGDGYDPSKAYFVVMNAEIYCTTTSGNEVAIAPKREDLSSAGIAGFTRALSSFTGEQRISSSWAFYLAPNGLPGGNGVPANNLRCQIQMWASATTGVSIRDGETSILMIPLS